MPLESREPDDVHRFKNHLTLTLSYCDLLLDELPADSPMRADIQEIQKAVSEALASLPALLARHAPSPRGTVLDRS